MQRVLIIDDNPDIGKALQVPAWTDLETAVSLVRAGAADSLAKPWDEEKLLTSVKNLLELREVQTASGDLNHGRTACRKLHGAAWSTAGSKRDRR